MPAPVNRSEGSPVGMSESLLTIVWSFFEKKLRKRSRISSVFMGYALTRPLPHDKPRNQSLGAPKNHRGVFYASWEQAILIFRISFLQVPSLILSRIVDCSL